MNIQISSELEYHNSSDVGVINRSSRSWSTIAGAISQNNGANSNSFKSAITCTNGAGKGNKNKHPAEIFSRCQRAAGAHAVGRLRAGCTLPGSCTLFIYWECVYCHVYEQCWYYRGNLGTANWQTFDTDFDFIRNQCRSFKIIIKDQIRLG